ncbi:MAG: GNAT family N-acetyltransferase [Desulfobacteraceae bacterium]|nr:GNAT family N-acetyltransferase [Desulfobacteraceae bacterium]
MIRWDVVAKGEMMAIALREELPDKNDYFSLFESTGWNQNYKASPEEFEIANRNSWLTLSAFDDSILVGFGRVVTDSTLHAMIFDLIVMPAYRGKGIGTMVFKALVKKCQEQGIRDIQLFCAKGQKGFYEKNGFEARPDDAPGMQLKKSKP